jgi:hypothetical protein
MRCGKSGSGRRVFGVSTPFVPRPRPLRSGGIPGAGVHADAGAPLYVAIPRLMIVTAPLSNAVEAGAPLYVAIPRSMCNLQLLAPLASRASRPSPLVSRPPLASRLSPKTLEVGRDPRCGRTRRRGRAPIRCHLTFNVQPSTPRAPRLAHIPAAYRIALRKMTNPSPSCRSGSRVQRGC